MNPDRPGASSSDDALSAVPWRRIALYLLASRVFICGLAYLSVYCIPRMSNDVLRRPLDLFRHWDANWYLLIAKEGYVRTKDGAFSSAFFPLYPVLMRIVNFACHDLRLAGYLVSNACLYGACLMLWKLVARDDRRADTADRAVLFFLFNPVAFFYSTIYSESLFFLLMVSVVYFATDRRWLAAGCCGYFASLTRPVGVLLVVVLLFEFVLPYFRRAKSESERPPWPAADAFPFVVSLVLIGWGVGIYMLYLANHLGDPLAFLHAESHWRRTLTAPWITWNRADEYGAFSAFWLRAGTTIGVYALVLGAAMKLRPAYSLLCLIYMTIYVSAGHLESLPRFLSVLFPFYISLARVAVRWPRLEPFLLAGSVMLLSLATILFADGYWFT
jgi:Gpi18-like mannosyltransferase